MARKILAALAIVAVGALLLLFWQARISATQSLLRTGESLELTLSDFGRLRLNITAASVQIVPARAGSVRVTINRVLGEARVLQRVHGSSAEIEIDHLGNNSFLLIEVPRHTDLDVHLNAGELKVYGIVGDKELNAKAGRIEVETSRSELGFVSAFVLAGRINAPVFQGDTGGIWRSRQWRGSGNSRLEISLLAGEAYLREQSRTETSEAAGGR